MQRIAERVDRHHLMRDVPIYDLGNLRLDRKSFDLVDQRQCLLFYRVITTL